MIEIANQTLDYFIKNQKAPSKSELVIKDVSLVDRKGPVFVTLYNKGEIIGSAGNIVDLESDLINEIISSTIGAYSDARFDNSQLEIKDIKIRIDYVKNRVSLGNDKSFKQVNPTKYGMIVIKKDYSKAGVILPNISPKLTSGNDLITYIGKKLDEVYNENDYINYVIETEVFRNF